MYYNYSPYNYRSNNNNRFIGGGLLAPLLVGGIAGYAIGNNNYKNYYPYPYPNYYPTYYPYNNYYYYYY